MIQERFSASRGVSPGAVQAGVDLYNVPATFSTGTGGALIALAEQAKSQGSWIVYGFHGIGADSNAIAADAHEALLAYSRRKARQSTLPSFGELAACFSP